MAVAWYPKQRGLVTGLAVGGFAGGAAFVSQLSQHFIAADMPPFSLLGSIGLAYIVIGIISGIFMSYPVDPASSTKEDVKFGSFEF